MKLTRSIRRRLNKKLRPNYTQENLFIGAFNSHVKNALYNKIKNATSLEEVDKIIDEFNVDSLLPAVNNLSNSVFSKSAKEFDLLMSSFFQRPDKRYLNLRSKGLLYKKEDFKPFLNAFKHNLTLIKDLPKDLSKKLKKAYFTGTSFRGTEFAMELKERLGKRAKTIVRTESAKITSTLTQARMQKLGLNAYIWSTSDDSRVRGSHSLLDGVLIFWGDPPTIDNYQNHCGRYVNCRCVPIPVVEVSDLKFPIKVAEHVNIQTDYIKGGKGKTVSKIISGSITTFTKEKFIEKFGNLFV